MKLKGKVEEIVFRNDDNGYTVLNVDADGVLVTAVGIFPIVADGELLEMEGEYKYNSRFGEQFAVTDIVVNKPDDIEGILKYLSSGLFRGVGEKTAALIVNYFGSRTLEVLENSPQELCKIGGIGKKKVNDIVQCYNQSRRMRESVFFLQKYDISLGLAMKIYAKYEEGTISIVSYNPYRLVEDIDGVGFITADKIAEKLGIDKHSEFRIRAGIIYTLQEASGRGGHTCLPKNILINDASKLLAVEGQEVSDVLDALDVVKKTIVDNVDMVSTSINFNVENSIAVKLLRLNTFAEEWNMNLDKELNDYEKVNDIVLDANQKKGILGAFFSGVSIITGGPGTGKTTIIKAIVTLAEQRNKTVILCAPTGRAGKRMSETTGMEAKTIHRLLGADASMDCNFEKNEKNPLTADIIIVDEISMADIYIFAALLKAIPSGARLVMVGDKDQLPSVSCGNILCDTIASGLIDTVYLDVIHRQEKGSMIVANAHRINKGEMPVFKDATDFFISSKDEPLDTLNDLISMIKTRIPGFAKVDMKDIQVLCPMKKGVLGVENVNLVLQKELNPNGREYIYRGVGFRVGDKVMQNVNNYDTEWIKKDGERGKGVFNGDIGYVVSVFGETVEVEFDDGKLAQYKGSDLDQIMLAYCVSVHKSQGSEFPVVILIVNGGNYMIMTKNLLYTAVTRARKMVVILGNQNDIGKMVSNNYTAKRYSLLKDLLIKTQPKLTALWG